MATIEAKDSIDIHCRPEEVFAVVANYPGWRQWFPNYHCEWLDPNGLKEGSSVSHRYQSLGLTLSSFTRRIDRIVPGQRLEERYIDGDLEGTGQWRFERLDDGCRVSYSCRVTAQHWFPRLSFRLFGAYSHHQVYRALLKALKDHCEQNTL